MEGNGMEMDSSLVWVESGGLKTGEKSVNVDGAYILVKYTRFGDGYSTVQVLAQLLSGGVTLLVWVF